MFDVLRLGHRSERDKRITTHLALLSRLYGCRKFLITSSDSNIKNSVDGVNKRFGGNTEVIENVKPSSYIKKWHGISLHLTMYGSMLTNIDKILKNCGNSSTETEIDLLFIVGAEKVPAWVYDAVDYNISVGNQPHSEVAALAILMFYIYGSPPLYKKRGGDLEIVPDKRGKSVINNKE